MNCVCAQSICTLFLFPKDILKQLTSYENNDKNIKHCVLYSSTILCDTTVVGITPAQKFIELYTGTKLHEL